MLKKDNNNNRARKIALLILNGCGEPQQTLDRVIANTSDNLSTLSQRDRALSNQLVYGVTRWQKKLDWIAETLSKKPITSLPPSVLNIIRIGLFQIFFMNRIPKFAAVNTAVNLTKADKAYKRYAGYVNAILRNAIRNPRLADIPSSKSIPTSHLALTKSFPEWILLRWVKRFGYEKTLEICDTVNTIPDIAIRVNTLKTNKNNLMTELLREAKKIEDLGSLPNALAVSKINRPINEMESFTKGMFSVQDGAAQIMSHLLSPNPGEVVLDACAGFGGKSTHMAQLMNNQGQIIAVDKIKSKLSRLTNDAKRLGIKIIQTKHLDLNIKPDPRNHPLFDRVMLDAPCSGIGVIRRNPDIKWSSSIEKLMDCSKKQLHLLKNISLLVKPRGTVAFVVCSTEPEENEHVVNTFLLENQHFKKKQPHKSNKKQLSKYLGKDGFFRIYPHIHKMDSFFAALLKREY